MLIPLSGGCGGCQEWAMIELQGSIEIQKSALHEKLQSLTIGELCKRSGGRFVFTVGYHELEGLQVSLKKPLLILKSTKQGSDMMEVDSTSSFQESAATGASSKVELQVVGIVRHKILFKNRPKALISKPETKIKAKRKMEDG